MSRIKPLAEDIKGHQSVLIFNNDQPASTKKLHNPVKTYYATEKKEK